MRIIRASATIFAISLFLMACNSNRPADVGKTDPGPGGETLTASGPEESEFWAKDNLDLPRVGALLERANDPAEFETLLNSDDGLNNLDLNGDGYVDYISVQEFDDRDDNTRGLSLFSRFGPDLIQEIATIIFRRDDRNSPGARIFLTGNEQIYGDNYYYETNWTDRPLRMVTTLFSDRGTPYRSPYYYDNYPPDYQVIQVVETPVYRTRIERIYPVPVFIYMANPSIVKIKIKSPHNGKWMNKIHAKLAKPTREQIEFIKNNPDRPQFVKVEKGRNEDFRADDKDRPGHERNDDKRAEPGKGGKHDGKSGKGDKGGNGKGKGKGKGN